MHYPFQQEPTVGDGSAVRIVPGVQWLRMPVFPPLNWINVWAVEDGDGWTVVDTGVSTAQTSAAWQIAFDGVLSGRPVKRVICTHMHPDHSGLVGWICEKFAAGLWMSSLEYLACRALIADKGRTAPDDGVRFYRAAGWNAAALEGYRLRFGAAGKMIYPLPDSYRRIVDGEWLVIGDHRWQVVVGSGHSPEHASLYCPELKLLIAGDQVLPKMSSEVSVHPAEPNADPLGNWLRSLARIKQDVPDDVLVLPSHNSPFTGLYHRIDELTEGYLRGLERLQEQLDKPRRVVDLLEAIFPPVVAKALLSMATGETLAYLNHLEARDRVRRETDADGVDWWRA